MKKAPAPALKCNGCILLAVTLLVYGAAALFAPDKTLTAAEESLGILMKILPVLLVVFFLTALLNTFLKPKSIAKHLGKGSRLRGWFIALFGGILSHGPGYVWYPMLADLRSQGARDSLIVAFFYARAIKLPWLPVMISYFGIGFTLVLSFYILLGAWLQGLIADKLLAKNEA
ncbi:permease [Sulfurimonas sp. HSL1-2]|uniref:permease n=1 Tax=Thiomicrolovo zhangzhouensis TaxID=3131933 RepID=UPI0031F905F0